MNDSHSAEIVRLLERIAIATEERNMLLLRHSEESRAAQDRHDDLVRDAAAQLAGGETE